MPPIEKSGKLKFLVDEDLPRSTARMLRELGFDAIDVRDCGLRGMIDEKIFEYAQAKKAVILTGDRGFGSILRFPPGTYHGIVVANFPNEVSVADLNLQIKNALDGLMEHDILGNLVIIEPKKIRIRRFEKE